MYTIELYQERICLGSPRYPGVYTIELYQESICLGSPRYPEVYTIELYQERICLGSPKHPGVNTLSSKRMNMARDSKVSWSVYLELLVGYGEGLQGLLECIP